MGRFETEGDELDSRPVTKATHPTYYTKWAFCEGSAPQLGAWRPSSGNPSLAANPRGSRW